MVGFRWSWTFNYVDQNTYDIGTPGEDPVLYLPVDQKEVRTDLSRTSFTLLGAHVPVQMDVVPGRTNKFEVTPNKEGTGTSVSARNCVVSTTAHAHGEGRSSGGSSISTCKNCGEGPVQPVDQRQNDRCSTRSLTWQSSRNPSLRRRRRGGQN